MSVRFSPYGRLDRILEPHTWIPSGIGDATKGRPLERIGPTSDWSAHFHQPHNVTSIVSSREVTAGFDSECSPSAVIAQGNEHAHLVISPVINYGAGCLKVTHPVASIAQHRGTEGFSGGRCCHVENDTRCRTRFHRYPTDLSEWAKRPMREKGGRPLSRPPFLTLSLRES